MTALSNQYCLPDGITPEIFLRDYWQKKPLIIRNGLPEIVGQFEPDDIIELLGIGNNPMVGCTVACAVNVSLALNK